MFGNKRQAFWFLSLALLFSLFLVHPASAAGRVRRPVEAMPALGVGSGYFYKEVNDFREIASRFSLSNAARCFGILDKDLRVFIEVLRFWPAESMSFLAGERGPKEGREVVCFALSYPEAYRGPLQKMASGKIDDGELRSLFLGKGRDDEELLRVTREEESPSIYKVRFGGLRFYCTARDNLLLCAFDEDDLEVPLGALSSGRHFRPEKPGENARNFAIFEAGPLTGDILSGFFGRESAERVGGKSLHVEADFAFQSGGWKLDVASNLIDLLSPGEGGKKTDPEPAEPAFERLGGGRLLAATSARLGKEALYSSLSHAGWRGVAGSSSPPILRALLNPGESGLEPLRMERVDVAAVSYPGRKWPNGIGVYTYAKVTNRDQLAALRRETDAFLAEHAKEDPYEKLESAKWKHLYAMDLRGDGIESSVMLGFADDAFMFSFLPRTGFDEPFSTDRARFEELAAKPDAFFYADFGQTRKGIREMYKRGDLERFAGRGVMDELFVFLLAATSDMTELSVVEKSPGTVTIEAQTARPEIEERMWLYELVEEMR